MLSYLPNPYDDELLYSIVARYFTHVGGARGASVEQLFGKRGVRAQVDLPSSLGRFAENTAALWGFTAEEIAEKYTLLPFYTYYAIDMLRMRAMEAIKSDSGMGLHSRLGINTSRVKVPQFLRYCPECVSEDFERRGETYWRRTHQLPGVLVCTDHKGMLANSAVPYRPVAFWDFIDASKFTRSTDVCPAEMSEREREYAYSIAMRCKDILLQKESRWSSEDRKGQYRTAAMNAGFLGGRFQADSKILSQAKLEGSFVGFFGRDLLAAIGCDVQVGSDTNWLRQIFRTRNRNCHPVQHALLEIFFEELPESGRLTHPFGLGPWRCPNTYCDQETAESIHSIQVRPDGEGKPVASARCPCGFRFTFRMTSGKNPVVDKIVLYGSTWVKQARDLVESGISKRAASRVLGVCQGTIDDLLKGRIKKGKGKVGREKILVWRNEWRSLLKQAPDRSRDKARTLNPKLYFRLRRHDPEWLYSKPRRFDRRPSSYSRVDWDSRDRDLVERLRYAAQGLRESAPLKRVSREGIIRHARLSRLAWKGKGRLPLCTSALQELAESVDDFRERRLRHAATVMAEKGLPWKPWILRKLTGLEGKELGERLKRVIEGIMSSQNNGVGQARDLEANPGGCRNLVARGKKSRALQSENQLKVVVGKNGVDGNGLDVFRRAGTNTGAKGGAAAC